MWNTWPIRTGRRSDGQEAKAACGLQAEERQCDSLRQSRRGTRLPAAQAAEQTSRPRAGQVRAAIESAADRANLAAGGAKSDELLAAVDTALSRRSESARRG